MPKRGQLLIVIWRDLCKCFISRFHTYVTMLLTVLTRCQLHSEHLRGLNLLISPSITPPGESSESFEVGLGPASPGWTRESLDSRVSINSSIMNKQWDKIIMNGPLNARCQKKRKRKKERKNTDRTQTHNYQIFFSPGWIQPLQDNDNNFDCKSPISHYLDEAQLIGGHPTSGYTGGRSYFAINLLSH